MSRTKLENLREVVTNEALPLAERRDAAAYAVRLMVDEVPVPTADDAEVKKLHEPMPRTTEREILEAECIELLRPGWSQGIPLLEALQTALERRKRTMVLAVVIDEGAHRIERLAACQSLLDAAAPDTYWKRNNYSAEKLLDTVKAPDGTDFWGRLAKAGKRPPLEIDDVW